MQGLLLGKITATRFQSTTGGGIEGRGAENETP